MRRSRSDSRAAVWITAVSVGLLPLALSSCSYDDGGTAGPEGGADIEDVTEGKGYFTDDQFVGQQVTLSAEVTSIVSPTSFVLNGREWGDDSVLVVSADDMGNLQEESIVQVTGTVQQFAYDDFAEKYGLAAAAAYQPYQNEEFVVASTVDMDVGDDSPAR